MKVLYQIPSLETVYAARFIYEGYKDAFIDMGHEFRPFTSQDNLKDLLSEFCPDIFISGLNQYNLKFLDLDLLHKFRKKGLVFFNQLQPWRKVNNQYGGGNLSSQKDIVRLIKKGLAGDIFFHWLEQDDPSMDGFTRETGYSFETIILAANTKKFYYDYDKKYESDISYVGSYLPDKRAFMDQHLIPLRHKYPKVSFYGSDWTFVDRGLGYIQKVGQYFNINPLKNIRKVKLPIEDERKVYSSSAICLNMHENHQRYLGCDFNERTFKIIASGGFEICDNVRIIRKYFKESELVIAENTDDWFDKIDYYHKHPEKRKLIVDAGMRKVLNQHTYRHRANRFIELYNHFSNK